MRLLNRELNDMQTKKIVFAGSPEIAVPSLEALAEAQISGVGWRLCAVLSNADTPKGRSGIPTPCAVKAAAEKVSAKLEASGFEPLKLVKDFELVPEADLLVCFAFGKIFPAEFIARFSLGGINVHPSLLPKYRGAAPIQQALLNMERETGLSIQRLAAKLDSGAILAQEKLVLDGTETSARLSALMAELSAKILPETVVAICSGTVKETKQDEAQATYCRQFKKTDGLINWNKTANEIDAQIRAFTPWPLSWSFCSGKQILILEGRAAPDSAALSCKSDASPCGTVLGVDKELGIIIKTGGGVFIASRLQWSGRKALDWKEFLNGSRSFIGVTLGN
jgi:methionyl-tRNA formyltransferase